MPILKFARQLEKKKGWNLIGRPIPNSKGANQNSLARRENHLSMQPELTLWNQIATATDSEGL